MEENPVDKQINRNDGGLEDGSVSGASFEGEEETKQELPKNDGNSENLTIS